MRIRCESSVHALAFVIAGGLMLPAAEAYVQRETRPRQPVTDLPLTLITQPWVGDLDGMIARRRIRLLTPYSPTHYFVDRGRQSGMAYEFGRKLEDELNRRLGTRPATRVHVVFVPTPANELVNALTQGRGDVIASNLTRTASLAGLIDFTVPGQRGVRKVLITGPAAGDVHSKADLAGLNIAVRAESAELDAVRTFTAAAAAGGVRQPQVHALAATLDDEDLLEMVDAGLLEATVTDDYIAAYWSRRLARLRVHSSIVFEEGVTIAWAVRRNNPQLLAMLNPIIEANRVGTAFGNTTLQKYVAGRPLGAATSGAAFERYRRLAGTFTKYGTQYSLDPLLLMAQGYQESGLNQSARSSKGAIGVMQVTKDAASDMNVGDVQQLDANIHAGTKYIRSIIDAHVGPTPADPLNRTLMAFAAYNCGPACLRRLRREAGRRGLDPDQWFNHVESVAGDLVGVETVGYVARIYKYYVAYKLSAAE